MRNRPDSFYYYAEPPNMSLEHSPARARKFIRTPAAAEFLGLSESTLEKMRGRGDGPAFVKLGPKAVSYAIEELERYARSRTRRSTADTGDGA
jgi:predicted DNA-binding transcriptional regulator AlpA